MNLEGRLLTCRMQEMYTFFIDLIQRKDVRTVFMSFGVSPDKKSVQKKVSKYQPVVCNLYHMSDIQINSVFRRHAEVSGKCQESVREISESIRELNGKPSVNPVLHNLRKSCRTFQNSTRFSEIFKVVLQNFPIFLKNVRPSLSPSKCEGRSLSGLLSSHHHTHVRVVRSMSSIYGSQYQLTCSSPSWCT